MRNELEVAMDRLSRARARVRDLRARIAEGRLTEQEIDLLNQLEQAIQSTEERLSRLEKEGINRRAYESEPQSFLEPNAKKTE